MGEIGPRTPNSSKFWMAAVGAAAILLVVVGIFWLTRQSPTTDLANPDLGSSTTTSLPVEVVVPDDCPVTIPDGSFVPSDDYPSQPGDEGKSWYGTDELWTVVPDDGISDFQKSVWWSANFPGPADEPHPEIEVTFRLLSDELDAVTNGNATVGRTPDEGLFMTVGFQPDFQGCWEATATYKDAALTYVYYSAEGRPMRVMVPNLVGLTLGDAFRQFGDDPGFFVSTTTGLGSIDETRLAMAKKICAQTPQAGETVPRGTTVLVSIPEDDGTCLDLSASIPVPDLVGLPLEMATLRLREATLSAGVYGSVTGSSVVCSQDPGAGTLVGQGLGVTIQVSPPGGCEELLNPNGLYSRTYVDEDGFEWLGTDCPAADVLIRGGQGDGLPHAGDTTMERVDRLLLESGSELAQPGVISFRALPRSGRVWDYAENGDVVAIDSEDDYMIKATVDASFTCPSAPYFWNGIPVAFVLDN